jgi:hypothetical protein
MHYKYYVVGDETNRGATKQGKFCSVLCVLNVFNDEMKTSNIITGKKWDDYIQNHHHTSVLRVLVLSWCSFKLC